MLMSQTVIPNLAGEHSRITRWLAATALLMAFAHAPRWPLAEAALGLLAIVLCAEAWRLRRLASGVEACLAICGIWIAMAAAPPASNSSLREIAQLLAVLLVGAWAFQTARIGTHFFYRTIAFAWWLSLAVAWWQYLRGDAPPAVAAFLDRRALFSVVMAIMAPLAWSASGGIASAFGALAACLVLLYLPGLALMFLASFVWAICCAPAKQRWLVISSAALAVILIAGGLTPRPNRIFLAESIAHRDREGMARRWVVEMVSAKEAVKDQPLFGSGPAQYQKTVSSGKYRRFAPATAEDRIEPHTQCGWLVLAVEFGLPAAFFLVLAAARASAALSRQRDEAGRELIPAAIALALFLPGMAATNWLVQGPGVLVAALLGLAGSACLSAASEAHLPTWRRAHLQAMAICAVIALATACRFSHRAPKEEHNSAVYKGEAIVIEAEDGAGIGQLWERQSDAHASQKACLLVAEAAKTVLLANPGVGYEIDCGKAGKYRLWLRCRWRDGCSNSVAVALDDGPDMLAGNDGTYGVWHWVEGPTVALGSGFHRLRLLPRESGAAVDQIVLLNNLSFCPTGIWGEKNTSDTARAAVDIANLPLWRPATTDLSDSFLIGMGGGHPPGPESYLVRLGLPYKRLRPEEYKSADSLKRFAIVWLAGYFEPDIEEIWKALNAYVASGGTAIIEHLWGYGRECRELLAPAILSRNQYGHGMSLEAAGSPFFQAALDKCNLAFHVCRFFGEVKGDGIEAHGRLLENRQPVGPVLMRKQFGKGRIYVLAVPIAFHSMKSDVRPENFETCLDRILLDAVGGRYDPLFVDMKWDAQPDDHVIFRDDFMRNPGEGRAWQVESGEFQLTGQSQNQLAFTLKATGEAWAVTGRKEWRSYRISASLLTENAEAGVWLTTQSGSRLALAWDEDNKALSLYRAADGRRTLLHRASVPGSPGWRRLSLLHRRSAWEAWLDNRLVFRVFGGSDDAGGQCGLFALRGQTWFDDVAMRDTAALLPDMDTCLGEEGSPRADPVFLFGIEPRMLYATTWYLRPDSEKRHAVRLALPTYLPALFRFDGEILGLVPPDREGPLVALPAGKKPQREIAVACLGWRDYIFQAQPTGWYETGGKWFQQPRWACDRRWSFLGTEARQESILWYRHPLKPPYTLCVYAAVAGGADARQHKGRDLNLILSGNGVDLSEGVRVLVNPEGRFGCEMWRGREKIAANYEVGLPDGYLLHHHWYCLKAIVEEERVRFYYEDDLVLDIQQRLPAGQVGFWTRAGQASIGRATISLIK